MSPFKYPQELKQAGSFILTLLGWLGLLVAGPRFVDYVFPVPDGWKMTVYLGVFLLLALIFFLYWLVMYLVNLLRDTPLDGFTIDASNQLCGIARAAMRGLDVRRRSPVSISAALGVKYLVIELFISRLRHLSENVLAILAVEMEREKGTKTPNGFIRVATSVSHIKTDLEFFRQDMEKWLRLVEPLLTADGVARLPIFEDRLERIGFKLTEWGAIDPADFEDRREGIPEELQRLVHDVETIRSEMQELRATLENDLRTCRKLAESL